MLRIVQPTRVLTQSPERSFQRIYASHPDHLAAGEATLCAVYPDSRNPFSFPELLDAGLEPWTVPEVWMMVGNAHNMWVDITDTFDRKVEALRAHTSQTAHMENLADFLRGAGEDVVLYGFGQDRTARIGLAGAFLTDWCAARLAA